MKQVKTFAWLLQGDSGSPLHCQLNTGQWVVAGISSWGSMACSVYPSVYTRITSYLVWIDEVTGEMVDAPPPPPASPSNSDTHGAYNTDPPINKSERSLGSKLQPQSPFTNRVRERNWAVRLGLGTGHTTGKAQVHNETICSLTPAIAKWTQACP